MTKVKLSEAEYVNLLSMTRSSDADNINVVHSILENLDVDTNIVYILMLYKECNAQQREKLFTDKITNAVDKYAVIKDHTFKNIDWATIIEIAKKQKEDPLQEGFAVSRFANEIETQLKDAGFVFMDEYKITLTKKHG